MGTEAEKSTAGSFHDSATAFVRPWAQILRYTRRRMGAHVGPEAEDVGAQEPRAAVEGPVGEDGGPVEPQLPPPVVGEGPPRPAPRSFRSSRRGWVILRWDGPRVNPHPDGSLQRSPD